MAEACSRLEARLGHTWRRRELLTQALTHRSFGAHNNERLEFLGDGVLNCVIGLMLYQRFPDQPEGRLSRLRANLVNQDSLHEIALELELGRHLRLGEGELKSGGAQRPSILADALESLLGAAILDAGFDVASGIVEHGAGRQRWLFHLAPLWLNAQAAEQGHVGIGLRVGRS